MKKDTQRSENNAEVPIIEISQEVRTAKICVSASNQKLLKKPDLMNACYEFIRRYNMSRAK